MKKALSVLLAGAMVAGMSVSAFATEEEHTIKILDSDGVENEDIYNTYKYQNYCGSINIDGVVPGAELYVPLGEEMSDFIEGSNLNTSDKLYFYNVELVTEADTDTSTPAKYNWEQVDSIDDATHYKNADTADADNDENDGAELPAGFTPVPTGDRYTVDSLTNDDYFKFDVDKDDGSKYIKDIEVVPDKKLGKSTKRTAYLKITLGESATTDDIKTSGTITFEAKDPSEDFRDASGSKKLTAKSEKWDEDAGQTIPYTIWINNEKKEGSDGDAETGDRVYFDPEDNEDNTFVWGDDRAALFFEGNDDAGAFYCRLQTKADSAIYAEYGDPVNADLWFYDFVNNPTIPTTSRATVTLGIPWDEDDDYTPNPEDCFIYEVDADGYLTDVTNLFTYDDENDGTTEIEGWSIKTRTLGTYVISDTELDVEVYEEVDEEEAPEVEEEVAAPADDVKAIPNTGSSDMVGAAVVAAVVSLAAAGAVAFKKASK